MTKKSDIKSRDLPWQVSTVIIIIFTVFFSVELFAKKVVSLAPNITEMLIFLNKTESIVGVTKYSKNPTNAKVVGDIMSLNYETIYSLKPDVVILLDNQKKELKKLSDLNIECLVVKADRLLDIVDSTQKINKKIFNSTEIKNIFYALTIGTFEINLNKKKVLIVVDRNPNDLTNIYVAGINTFINDYLTIINLNNLIKDSGYVKVNLEYVFNLNPDVIIDLTIGANVKNWLTFNQLKAVKENNVFSIQENYFIIPSPYIFEHLFKLKEKINEVK